MKERLIDAPFHFCCALLVPLALSFRKSQMVDTYSSIMRSSTNSKRIRLFLFFQVHMTRIFITYRSKKEVREKKQRSKRWAGAEATRAAGYSSSSSASPTVTFATGTTT